MENKSNSIETHHILQHTNPYPNNPNTARPIRSRAKLKNTEHQYYLMERNYLNVIIGEVRGEDGNHVSAALDSIFEAIENDLEPIVRKAVGSSKTPQKQKSVEIYDNLTFKTTVIQDQKNQVNEILIKNGLELPDKDTYIYSGSVVITIDNELGSNAAIKFLQSKKVPNNCSLSITVKILEKPKKR